MHSNCSSPLLLNILSEIALKSSELFGLYGEQLRDTFVQSFRTTFQIDYLPCILKTFNRDLYPILDLFVCLGKVFACKYVDTETS